MRNGILEVSLGTLPLPFFQGGLVVTHDITWGSGVPMVAWIRCDDPHPSWWPSVITAALTDHGKEVRVVHRTLPFLALIQVGSVEDPGHCEPKVGTECVDGHGAPCILHLGYKGPVKLMTPLFPSL